MKIALCLSGLPEFYQLGFKSFEKEILNKYDTDVFLHSWFDAKLVGSDYYDNKFRDNRDQKIAAPILENTDTDLLKLYTPKTYVIEPQKDFSHLELPSLRSALYSIQTSIQLMRDYSLLENVKYDYVIRARYDMAFALPFDLERFNSHYLSVPIYTMNDLSFAYLTSYGVFFIWCDFLAISSQEIMINTYGQIFETIDYYRKTKLVGRLLPHRGEYYHVANAVEKTIPVSIFKMDYNLIRNQLETQ